MRARGAAHAAAGRALRHLGLDGSLRAHAAALPACDHQRPRPRAHAACSARGSPTSRAICAHRDVDVALARVTAAVAGLGGRHAHRRVPRRIQSPLGAAPARAERDRAADQRRPRRATRARGSPSRWSACTSPARRLVWLNPLLRYAGFEARPAGIRAMLPSRRRFPAGAQSRQPDGAGRSAVGSVHARAARAVRLRAAAMARPRTAAPNGNDQAPESSAASCRRAVWEALNDPASLAACIPGCESLERIGENAYRQATDHGARRAGRGQVSTAACSSPTSTRRDGYTLRSKGRAAPRDSPRARPRSRSRPADDRTDGMHLRRQGAGRRQARADRLAARRRRGRKARRRFLRTSQPRISPVARPRRRANRQARPRTPAASAHRRQSPRHRVVAVAPLPRTRADLPRWRSGHVDAIHRAGRDHVILAYLSFRAASAGSREPSDGQRRSRSPEAQRRRGWTRDGACCSSRS